MTTDASEGIGAGLDSDDAEVILEAAEAIVADLRSGNLRREDIAELAGRFVELAEHDDPFIRQAVVEACVYLPDEEADEILARAIHDDAAYVARRAVKVSADRAVNRKKRARADEQNANIQDIVDEFGEMPQKSAKPLAKRLVRLAKKEVATVLNHEIGKAFTRPEFALLRAKAEIAKAVPDREEVAAKIDVALEGFRKVLGIVGAVLADTETLKTTFVASVGSSSLPRPDLTPTTPRFAGRWLA